MSNGMIASADGCKGGWLVAMTKTWSRKERPRLITCPDFQDLLAKTKDCRVVVVDVPIGLPQAGNTRACDTQARNILGASRNSCFYAPPYECLRAGDAREFQEIHRKLQGRGAGFPVWGIVPKLRNVHDHVGPRHQERKKALEFHPELVWWRLNGSEPLPSKHTAAGVVMRQQILRQFVPHLIEMAIVAPGDEVQIDDFLDALVGLDVAHRIAHGDSDTKPLTKNHEKDGKGLRMEIWF